jgi:[acyl-carrier-protein] S-malonyltransferase
MGRELGLQYSAARELFDAADSILGFAISNLMWEGPQAELDDTINTQPALFIHSMAAYGALSDLHPGFRPAWLAGHSLGQLSALAVGGAISFEDGLRLVRRRGELMKRAGDLAPGRMAAVLGLDIATLERVCEEASTDTEIVQVANDNCPGQVVISGAEAAVQRALVGAKSAGARRAIALAVSIAAHSPLMASIQADWGAAVEAATFKDPEIPAVGNVQAQPLLKADAARADLVNQMQSRVRWTETVQLLTSGGIRAFVEVGSGTVLAGLIARISKEASAFPLGTPADFEIFA